MSTTVDNRVVSMTFDAEDFEAKVKSCLVSLKSIDKAVNNLTGTSKAFDDVSFRQIQNNVENLSNRFTLLGTIGRKSFEMIADQVVALERKVLSFAENLTVGQIGKGWDAYAEKTKAVATIMQATGKSVSSVEEQLDRLNWFTDETSYEFMEMTNSISKFTAQGQDLETSVTAMQGIANWAAAAGQNAQTASRAMYNISQAMGVGAMKMADWRSIELANMATSEFKEAALQAGIACGTLVKEQDRLLTATGKTEVTLANFSSTLAEGWFDTNTMMKVFNTYGEFADRIYELDMATDQGATSILTAFEKYKKAVKTGKDLELNEIFGGIDDEYVDTLVKAFEELNKEEYSVGYNALIAAQKARTFTDAIEAGAAGARTAWMKLFQTIFGNVDEASELWTYLANTIYNVFAEPVNKVQELVEEAFSGDKSFDIFQSKIEDTGLSMNDFIEEAYKIGKKYGAITDEMIEEAGSFQNSLKTGWLSSTIFAETLDNMSVGAVDAAKDAETVLNDYLNAVQSLFRGEHGDWYRNGHLSKTMLEAAGYDYDTMSHLLRKLQRNGGAVSDGYFTVKDLSEAAIDASESTATELEEVKKLASEARDAESDISQLLTSAQKVTDQMSGRELFLGSLYNFMDGLDGLTSSIVDSFGEIFGGSFAGNIRKFLQNLYGFSSIFSYLTTGNEHLKDTLSGVLSIVKSITDFIRPITYFAASVLGHFGADMLDIGGSVLGSIGRLITGINSLFDMSKLTGWLDTIKTNVNGWLDGTTSKIVKWIDGVTINWENLKAKIEKNKLNLEPLTAWLNKSFGNNRAIIKFKAMYAVVASSFFKAINLAGSGLSKVKNYLEGVYDVLKGKISPTLGRDIINNAIEKFRVLKSYLIGIKDNVVTKIVGAFSKNNFKEFKMTLGGFTKNANGFKKIVNDIKTIAYNALKNASTRLNEIFNSETFPYLNNFKNRINRIINGVKTSNVYKFLVNKFKSIKESISKLSISKNIFSDMFSGGNTLIGIFDRVTKALNEIDFSGFIDRVKNLNISITPVVRKGLAKVIAVSIALIANAFSSIPKFTKNLVTDINEELPKLGIDFKIPTVNDLTNRIVEVVRKAFDGVLGFAEKIGGSFADAFNGSILDSIFDISYKTDTSDAKGLDFSYLDEAFSKLTDITTSFEEKWKIIFDTFQKIKFNFKNFATDDNILSVASGWSKVFLTLAASVSIFKTGKGIKNAFKGLRDAFKIGGTAFGGSFDKLGKAFDKLGQGFDVFKDFGKTFKKPVESFAKVFDSISTRITKIGNAERIFILAKALLAISAAVGVLVLSLWGLQKIDKTDIWESVKILAVLLGSLTLMMGVLLGLSSIGGASGGGFKIASIGLSVLAMVGSLLLMSDALRKIADIPIDVLKEGSKRAGLMAAVILVFFAAVAIISKGVKIGKFKSESMSFRGLGFALIGIVAAIWLMSNLMTKLSTLEFTSAQLQKSIGIIARLGAILAIFSVFVGRSELKIKSSLALFTLITALQMLVKVTEYVTEFVSKTNIDDIKTAQNLIGILGLFLGAMAIMVGASTFSLGAGLGLIAAVFALRYMITVLEATNELVEVSDRSTLTTSMTIITLLMAFMSLMAMAVGASGFKIKNAMALIVAALAIRMLVGVVTNISKLAKAGNKSSIITASIIIGGIMALLSVLSVTSSNLGIKSAVAFIGLVAAIGGIIYGLYKLSENSTNLDNLLNILGKTAEIAAGLAAVVVAFGVASALMRGGGWKGSLALIVVGVLAIGSALAVIWGLGSLFKKNKGFADEIKAGGEILVTAATYLADSMLVFKEKLGGGEKEPLADQLVKIIDSIKKFIIDTQSLTVPDGAFEALTSVGSLISQYSGLKFADAINNLTGGQGSAYLANEVTIIFGALGAFLKYTGELEYDSGYAEVIDSVGTLIEKLGNAIDKVPGIRMSEGTEYLLSGQLTSILTAISDFLDENVEIIGHPGLAANFESIGTMIERMGNAIDKVPGVVKSDGADYLLSHEVNEILDSISTFLKKSGSLTVKEGIPETFVAIGTMIQGIADANVDQSIANLKNTWAKILNDGGQIEGLDDVLNSLITPITSFLTELTGIDGYKPEDVIAASEVISSITDLIISLPKESAISEFFTGSKFNGVKENLGSLGEGIGAFISGCMGSTSAVDYSSLESNFSTIEKIFGLVDGLGAHGGLWQKIVGDTVTEGVDEEGATKIFSYMGESLKGLGTGMADFLDIMSGITPETTAFIDETITPFIGAMIKAYDSLPAMGGVNISGKIDPARFGVQMVSFADNIKRYSGKVTGLSESDLNHVSFANDIIQYMAASAQSIGEVDPNFLNRDTNFGEKLLKYVPYIEQFVDAMHVISDEDIDHVTSILNALNSIFESTTIQNASEIDAAMGAPLEEVYEWYDKLLDMPKNKGLDPSSYGMSVKDIFKGLMPEELELEIPDIFVSRKSIDESGGIKGLVDVVQKASDEAGAGIDWTTLLDTWVVGFKDALSGAQTGDAVGTTVENDISESSSSIQASAQALGDAIVAGLKSSFEGEDSDGLSSISDAMILVGSAMLDGFMSSMHDITASVSDAMGTIRSQMDRCRQDAYTKGQYVGQGFANGINSKWSEVHEAALNLCRAATESITYTFSIASPSKLTMKYGAYVGEGLAIGMRSETANVAQSATIMALGAVSAIDQASASIVETNLGAQLSGQFAAALASAEENLEDEGIYIPVIVDTDPASKALSSLNGIVSSTSASMAAKASLGNVSNITENQNGSTATRASYNFIQNNYSPKAVDRATIYRQSKGLISSAAIAASYSV